MGEINQGTFNFLFHFIDHSILSKEDDDKHRELGEPLLLISEHFK